MELAPNDYIVPDPQSRWRPKPGSFFTIVLGTGDVYLGRVILRTSDRSSPVVVLNAVSQPLHVADLVRHHVERCRALKGVREIDS